MDRKCTMMRHSFSQRVYEAVKQIPSGQVATYGEIAWRIGALPGQLGRWGRRWRIVKILQRRAIAWSTPKATPRRDMQSKLPYWKQRAYLFYRMAGWI